MREQRDNVTSVVRSLKHDRHSVLVFSLSTRCNHSFVSPHTLRSNFPLISSFNYVEVICRLFETRDLIAIRYSQFYFFFLANWLKGQLWENKIGLENYNAPRRLLGMQQLANKWSLSHEMRYDNARTADEIKYDALSKWSTLVWVFQLTVFIVPVENFELFIHWYKLRNHQSRR